MDFMGAYSPDHLSFLMEGFWVTLKVAFISIVLSFLIGSIVGILRYARIPVLSHVLAFVVEIIRNLPLLLIIFLHTLLYLKSELIWKLRQQRLWPSLYLNLL